MSALWALMIPGHLPMSWPIRLAPIADDLSLANTPAVEGDFCETRPGTKLLIEEIAKRADTHLFERIAN